MLWFGDERGYNATQRFEKSRYMLLWFGDERGYNATAFDGQVASWGLWFGDERGYNATARTRETEANGCGLVMKEDITQLASAIL